MVRTQFWLLSLSARIHPFSKYVLSACSALDTSLFCYLHILHFSLTALIGAVPSLPLAILSGHQFQSPVSSKLAKKSCLPTIPLFVLPPSPVTPRTYPPCSLVIFLLHLLRPCSFLLCSTVRTYVLYKSSKYLLTAQRCPALCLKLWVISNKSLSLSLSPGN